MNLSPSIQPIESGAAAAASGSLLGNWILLFALTAVVVGLAYLLVYFQKKNTRGRNSPRINIVDMHRFGPREAIVFCEIGERAFLLGYTQQSITLLVEFPPISEDRNRKDTKWSEP